MVIKKSIIKTSKDSKLYAGKETLNKNLHFKRDEIKVLKSKTLWTPNMSVHEETIDYQHKALLLEVEKINNVISSRSTGVSDSELKTLRSIIHVLSVYTNQHFSYEEKYMRENNYPDLENHIKIHQSFIKYYEELKKDLNIVLTKRPEPGESVSDNLRKVTDKCSAALNKWWQEHILIEDHKYSEYIDSKQKKNVPEDKLNAKVIKEIKAQRKPIEAIFERNQKIKGNLKKSSKKGVDFSKVKAEIESNLHKGEQMEERPESFFKKIAGKFKGNKYENFILTKVPGLDALFEHGIPKGSTVIVAGGAGSGKTIMCLQTLYNQARLGKKCLYMSFEESEERLTKHMIGFGWDIQKVKKNMQIKRFSPFDITRSVDALLMKAKGELLIDIDPVILPNGFKPDILVLDSLTAIASAFTGKEDSYRIYIEQLFRFFEKMETTSFLITETEQIPKIFSTSGVEEFLADGVIVLYNIKRGNIRENAIEILKMRGEHHQKKIVAMQITEEGMMVYPEQEVFGGIGDD